MGFHVKVVRFVRLPFDFLAGSDPHQYKVFATACDEHGEEKRMNYTISTEFYDDIIASGRDPHYVLAEIIQRECIETR